MRVNHRNPKRPGKFAAAALALGLFFPAKTFSAETVTFHLRTGERITGTIVSQSTNRVVVSNLWASELSIPLAQIEKRKTNVVVSARQVSTVAKNSSKTTTVVTKPTTTNRVAAAAALSKTNALSTLPKPPKQKLWHAQVDLGLDLRFGKVDLQIYSTRLKHIYARPYLQNPSKYFRNTFDYLFEYGETDGVLSANRMVGSDKIDFDIGRNVFVYNLFGAGYDEIRKIDLSYELGPGVGYHLFTLTNFVMNVEGGANYQVQNRSAGQDTENFYYRLAEDFTWRIHPTKLTLTEKFEFFPRAEDLSQYRARFASKLSFPLLQNISFNFSIIDLYDTQPAPNVSKNELQFLSSIGVTF